MWRTDVPFLVRSGWVQQLLRIYVVQYAVVEKDGGDAKVANIAS